MTVLNQGNLGPSVDIAAAYVRRHGECRLSDLALELFRVDFGNRAEVAAFQAVVDRLVRDGTVRLRLDARGVVAHLV